MGWHEDGDTQTPFDLTASSIVGINGGTGFQTSDVGRTIRLLGSDAVWRWAQDHQPQQRDRGQDQAIRPCLAQSQPDRPLAPRHLRAGKYVESGSLYEERLAFSRKFSVYASATGDFDNFATGEKDDAALEFVQAGGGQANDIIWIAESDGALIIGTLGGIRALSGSGIDEALTPSSFKVPVLMRSSPTEQAAPGHWPSRFSVRSRKSSGLSVRFQLPIGKARWPGETCVNMLAQCRIADRISPVDQALLALIVEALETGRQAASSSVRATGQGSGSASL